MNFLLIPWRLWQSDPRTIWSALLEVNNQCYSFRQDNAVLCKPVDVRQPLLGGWRGYRSLSVVLNTLWS